MCWSALIVHYIGVFVCFFVLSMYNCNSLGSYCLMEWDTTSAKLSLDTVDIYFGSNALNEGYNSIADVILFVLCMLLHMSETDTVRTIADVSVITNDNSMDVNGL